MAFDRFTALPRQSRNVLQSLIARRLRAQSKADASSLARMAAVPPALGTVWRARGDILEFLRFGDEALAYDLRRRFGLGAPLADAQPVPETLFAGPAEFPKSAPATVILPIYNAFDMVQRLLTHLPETLPAGQRVLLVDDGSDDPRLQAVLDDFLKVWSSASLLSHPKNTGFVAAVNTGLAKVEPNDHVILLNSDTLPPKDWVPRLLAPLRDANVATVTPMSNNAEILSVPRPGIDARTSAALVSAIDSVAIRLNPRRECLPTGIGFCMAMNRRFLDMIGGFDPAFGKGYGEEVDWCLKAEALGGRHVAANNLFVGHSGGASFGVTERRARLAKASRVIATRYPDYPPHALDWERRDPLAPERLAMALAWAAATATGPVPVCMAHVLGGGAEVALQREVQNMLADTSSVVLLRVGGPAHWRIELRGTRFAVSGDVGTEDLLHALLAPLSDRHVIYSCGVHAATPARVPEVLLRLAKGHRLSLRLHDFFMISPSWNLIGSDGRYRGVPSLDTRDVAHDEAVSRLSHRGWREKWGRVIDAADVITAYAASGRDLLETAYPNARGKTVVTPHVLQNLPVQMARGGQSIGVLGGINLAKGGAVLEQLARKTSRRIVIVGEMDGRFQLPSPHKVLGRYDQADIGKLTRQHDIGLWLIPSICPETFSFATHEALATKLPVAVFDIGAQAEAARAAVNGHILCAGPDDISAVARHLESLFD